MGNVVPISAVSESTLGLAENKAKDLLRVAEGLLEAARQIWQACPQTMDPADLRGERRDMSLPPIYLALAKDMYRDRRTREKFVPAGLLGEPAWDILLDLFIAAIEGKFVSVTSACIGSGVPSTTALRWLTVLERDGLIERVDCDADRRRAFVRLTDSAFDAMKNYFKNTEEGSRSTQQSVRTSMPAW